MDILIKIIQLILSLSILVILHELGHFIPAKIFKTHVEKFFLFFDPWFAIFKKKIGSTIYGIGWLPLGGYVKISGIINENHKIIKKKYQSWEFRFKPYWQRLIIMIGGIVMNILLAIIIFSWILFRYGKTYLPLKDMKYGIFVNNIGKYLGFEDGDIIQNIDGKKIESYEELYKSILLGKSVKVERNKKNISFFLGLDKKKILFNQKNLKPFLYPRIPAIIKKIIKQSNAEKSNLKKGDKIIGINYQPIVFVDQIIKILSKHKNNNVIFSIKRNKNLLYKRVKIDKNGNIGVYLEDITDMPKIFHLKNEKYTLLSSIPFGIKETWKSLETQLNSFKEVFNIKNNAYKQIGSIFSITKSFSSNWNWYIFWMITGNLSIWLAFLNILPIPALDGGYIFFILIEIITRKKLKEKTIENSISIGFLFLTILMIIILCWDTFKTFFS